MTTRYCTQCKANYECADDLVEEHGPFAPADFPAQFYVTGTVEDLRSRSGRRPYHANLCDGHTEILLSDEGEDRFKVKELK